MTTQRLSQLQWLALFAGAVGLAAAHTLGFGLTLAQCNVGSGRWGIDNDPWEAALLSTAAFVMVLAGVASLAVIVRTQDLGYDDDPPLSRIRFFAIAALVANVLYTAIMMLDLLGNLLNSVCRGA
jgi:hypothetical protein